MFGLVPFNFNNPANKEDNKINSIFDIFDEPFFQNAFAPVQSANSFKVDVKDLGSAYELTAELPGIKKENISLNYDKDYLTIKTTVDKEEKSDDTAKETPKYLRRERYYGEMQRSFYIGDIDSDNIKASYKDGVLTVTLPKTTKKETATTINVN